MTVRINAATDGSSAGSIGRIVNEVVLDMPAALLV
jgi:hypothetical protein